MRHLRAAAEADIDQLLRDYTYESVVYTPDGPVRGLEALREFFSRMLDVLPEDWFDSFPMMLREIDGDVAYLVWKAEPAIPMVTDTFVIRGGKICTQTFCLHPTAA